MISQLIECHRCGKLSCEESEEDFYCPFCFYLESKNSASQVGGLASATPSDAMAPDVWDFYEAENLGEFIEQVPSDLTRWKVSLDVERNLRMTEYVQNDDQNSNFKKEPAPYELVAFPDEEKGTSWIRHGLAWPTKDGKRLRIKMFMDLPLPENGKLLLVESLKTAPRNRSEDTPF